MLFTLIGFAIPTTAATADECYIYGEGRCQLGYDDQGNLYVDPDTAEFIAWTFLFLQNLSAGAQDCVNSACVQLIIETLDWAESSGGPLVGQATTLTNETVIWAQQNGGPLAEQTLATALWLANDVVGPAVADCVENWCSPFVMSVIGLVSAAAYDCTDNWCPPLVNGALLQVIEVAQPVLDEAAQAAQDIVNNPPSAEDLPGGGPPDPADYERDAVMGAAVDQVSEVNKAEWSLLNLEPTTPGVEISQTATGEYAEGEPLQETESAVDNLDLAAPSNRSTSITSDQAVIRGICSGTYYGKFAVRSGEQRASMSAAGAITHTWFDFAVTTYYCKDNFTTRANIWLAQHQFTQVDTATGFITTTNDKRLRFGVWRLTKDPDGGWIRPQSFADVPYSTHGEPKLFQSIHQTSWAGARGSRPVAEWCWRSPTGDNCAPGDAWNITRPAGPYFPQ